MQRRALLGGLAAVPVWMVAGCGSDSKEAQLRLVNASAAYPSLDLYVDDDSQATGVAYGTAGSYVSIGDGSRKISIASNGLSTYLLSQTQSLSGGDAYTAVAYGNQGSLAAAFLSDTEDSNNIDAGKSRVRLLNTAIDAGKLDFYLTADDATLTDATAVNASVAGGGAGSFADVATGTYRLRVTGAGERDDIRLDVSGVALAEKAIVTFITTGTAGGVLVNGLMLEQAGALQALNNTSGRVRVIAAINGATVGASAGGTALMSEISSPAVGNYTLVPAGAQTLSITVDGAAVAVPAFSVTAGNDVSILLYGTTDAPQVTVIADDNRRPSTTSKIKMRLINAVAGVASQMTLTVNYVAIASSVPYATASSYGAPSPSTSATLQVTAPGSGVLFDLTDNVTLTANYVYTVFMLGASGAVAGQLAVERGDS